MSAEAKGTAQRVETAPAVVVRRTIPASPEELFDAWTDAEGMRQWLLPATSKDVKAVLDVRVGGRFTIDMIDGLKVFAHHGEYRIVDRPHKLVFTWNAEWIPGGSLVTIEFLARGESTEIVLTHERLPDAQLRANHSEGWGSILDRLAQRFS